MARITIHNQGPGPVMVLGDTGVIADVGEGSSVVVGTPVSVSERPDDAPTQPDDPQPVAPNGAAASAKLDAVIATHPDELQNQADAELAPAT